MLKTNDTYSHLPKLQVILLISSIGFVSGCSTLSQGECETAGWREIGFSDALHGKSMKVLADHRKSCAKHGISVDDVNYREGYENGLKKYCSWSHGQQHGAKGLGAESVCADNIAYNGGRRQGMKSYCTAQSGSRLGSRREEYKGQCSGAAHRTFIKAYVESLKEQLDIVRNELDDARDEYFRHARISGVPVMSHKDRDSKHKIDKLETLHARVRKLEDERDKIKRLISMW